MYKYNSLKIKFIKEITKHLKRTSPNRIVGILFCGKISTDYRDKRVGSNAAF